MSKVYFGRNALLAAQSVHFGKTVDFSVDSPVVFLSIIAAKQGVFGGNERMNDGGNEVLKKAL